MKNTAYIRVRIEGANTAQDVLNEVNSWFEDRAPFKITPEGNHTFLLCWPLLVDPGSLQNFGADIKDPSKWTKLDCFEGFDNQSLSPGQTLFPDVCAPDLAMGQQVGLGRVVVLSNPSSTMTLRVNSLQLANTWQKIALDSMDYHNPSIEALGWVTVISSPVDIPPGSSMTQDVPDTELSGTHIYARSMYLSTSVGDTARPAVYEIAAAFTPTITLFGAAVVILLLVYGSAKLLSQPASPPPVTGESA
jgi:hypothetical protein